MDIIEQVDVCLLVAVAFTVVSGYASAIASTAANAKVSWNAGCCLGKTC
jgi:hypothetical protein